MALVATRSTTKNLKDFPSPMDFCQGSGNVLIESEYWDHPTGAFSLLLKQTITTTDHNFQVIGKTVETWIFESLIKDSSAIPTRHLKETHARVWLPGVTMRGDVILVERQQTVYWLASMWSAGPRCHRTVKSGYVIYDLMPKTYSASSVQSTLEAQGVKAPTSASRIIPDTARAWTEALRQRAVVERVDHPQTAMWLDPWEVEEVTIDDDFLRTVEWTVRKDYTKPGPPDVSSRETAKARGAYTFILPLKAPTISVSGYGPLLIQVESKPDYYQQVWPVETKAPIRVQKFGVYKRVVVPPTVTAANDPWGLHATDPGAGSAIPIIETKGVTDFAGDAAAELPGKTTYSEAESNADATVHGYEHVGDFENTVKDPEKGGKCTLQDADVGPEGTYEYFAVSLIGDTVSPESNHSSISIPAGVSHSGLIVRKIIPLKEPGEELSTRPIELDVSAPPSVADALGIGETALVVVPALVDTVIGSTAIDGGSMGISSWPSGVLMDAEDLARAIALRTLAREQERLQVSFASTAPLALILERGQVLKLPEIDWTTYGNDRVLSSAMTESEWFVEGFGLSVRRNGEALDVSFDDITLEEVAP